MSYRLATDFYMQQTTYKHDYNPGISPRNRQTDYPYGADAPKADVPGPMNNFRPRFGDPLPQHIRDLDGQRFDEAPLTDRQRVKRGEEWIGGRRYEEPRTDRGRYYETDGQRNISPNRYPERGRNGSPDRHLDRGREYDRPRNESPSRWDRDRNSYNPVDDRYEKPLQPMIESYANHHKLADRTTYRDYGEFLQDKIKREELRKQPLEYPAANLRDQLSHRDTYRERMYGPDIENRYNTRDNDRFRNTDKGRQAEATSRREVDKIQLHDGNFKPWARNAYQNPYHNPPKSTNSGVYLFMRTHMDGKSDVVKALKEGRSVLANSYGQLKGIANNTEIHFLEGRPDGWTHVPSSKSERTWDVGDTVIIFWFPTRKEAEMWLYHEKKFQRASFPEYHGSDMACLPINWNPENDRHYPTFLVTEYEGIVDPDQFREKFVANMYDVLQRHKAERFVIQTVGIKMFRGNWFKQRSVVTCNRFPSSQAALEFYNDPDYERLRRSVRDISKSRTTFMFTLTERPV